MSERFSLPFVSVLVPCRNEVAFIQKCMESIVRNGYPDDRLQILVIDGMSTDGTREVVRGYARRHNCVTMLDNPRLITPVALNVGIRAAHGAHLLWMSAHNEYERDYIHTCVDWAMKSGADNVGGVIVTVPRDDGFVGRAIAAALTHPFGVGGSKFRTSVGEPVWVDTVFGGCYRRDVFDRVGYFNERLVRGQDFEFNMRLKKAGLRTLLVPTIRSIYYARSRPLEFLKHNWRNGEWAILPFRYSDVVPVSLRHLLPMFFAGAVILTGLLALFFPGLRWLPLLVTVPYLSGAIWAAVRVALNARDARLVFAMPVVFISLHLSYGIGSLWGAVRTLGPLLRHLTNRPHPTLRIVDDHLTDVQHR